MLKSMINPDSSGKKRSLVLGFMLIMLLALSTNLMAADQTVINNNDSGAGSLRKAITDVGDGETITFDTDYTITLASELSIAKSLTITGTGAGNTIIQANANPNTATYRVFNISSGTVTISDMTIRNGNTTNNGGGIYHDSATLTLNNCTVSGNTASNYGGGIYKYVGTLTMTNCTVSGNTADDSGGIHNYVGNLTMTNCTVSGNTANDGSWSGGGLTNESDVSTITNCTFANNTSTYNDGGGIFLYAGTLNIKNTIVANNNGYSGPADYYYSSGTLTDNGYNLVEITNVGAGAGGFSNGTNNDIVGAGTYNLSTTLEENNTTNGTWTLKTTDGSAAINAGDPDNIANNGVAIPTTDQRGANRKDATDIGAYEYWDDAGSLPVTLSIFTAQFIENTPMLYWTTQSETDNMGWFVYRGEENSFTTSEKISDFIEGHGTTTQQQSYIYEDRIQNPQVGDTYYYWLESVDYSGIVNHYDKVAVLTIPDQPDPGGGLIPEPVRYGLFQNEPNPVISSTKISFNLPETSQVELNIYNLKGQLVKSLYSGVASSKTLDWNGKDGNGNELQAGVYLYKLLVNGKTAETKKLILMK